ncbi:MAG: protein kinase domain-containing protein [Planctomycetota bacterium]
MNQPNQPADDFDPEKTVPSPPLMRSHSPPQQSDGGDLSATILGPDSIGPESPVTPGDMEFAADPHATLPQTEASQQPTHTTPAPADSSPDFDATIVGAVDDKDVTGSKDLDAEDAAGTQPGIPDLEALGATIVPPSTSEVDAADVNSTQAWSPELAATQASEGPDKLLLDQDDDGSANTIPGKKSTPGPAGPAGSKPPATHGSAPGRSSQPARSGGGSAPRSVSASGAGRGVGKSTWNLKIHSHLVNGEISGIVNSASSSTPGVSGLASAMFRSGEAPEYEVLGKLGNGAMGIVYRALQTSLNRELAIKTLRGDVQNPRLSQEMFVSEAVITANLVHPNIVPIHDLGRNSEGKLFYSMKQIQGREWRKVMKTLSLEENLDILLKVCDAVAFAHSRGVINRDLKPENVVTGSYGEVVVLDWGLAVTLPEFPQRESVLTEVRGGAGSPAYMAPELLDTDASGVCRQSDVYLLGGMLYEILEGHPPHLLNSIRKLATPRQQMQAVLTAVTENQIEEDTKNRGELMQIARKAMATKPADRYETVELLQDAIREYRITGRAEELLAKARAEKTTNYDFYQQAVALFTDALSKWPENDRATRGDLEAREAFAELARTKGDFDLGLEVLVNTTEPRLAKLAATLKREKTVRKVVRTTWTVLFAATAILLVFSVNMLVQNDILQGKNNDLALDIEKNQELAAKADARAKAANKAEEQSKEAAQLAEAATRLAEETAKQAENNRIEAEKTAAAAIETATAAEEQATAARTKAEAEVKKANIAVADAEMQKAKAQEQAVEALEKTAAAEAKQKLTEETSKRREALDGIRTLVSSVESGYELRDYAKVLSAGREAIEKIRGLLSDELFANDLQWLEQQEKSLQDKLDRAARVQGIGQAAFPGNTRPVLSALSSNGRIFASIFNPEAVDGRRHIEFHNVTDIVQPLTDNLTGRLEFPVTETRSLLISKSGNAVCLTGPATPFLWIRRDSQGWQQIPLEIEHPPTIEAVRMLHAHFSPDEQRLYLIGDDRAATLQIFDLTTETPRPLLAVGTTLFLQENANYRCSDSALLPDESALLVCSRSGRDHQLRAFSLQWTDGTPQLIAQGPGRKVPSLTGLNSTFNDTQLPGDAAIRLLQVAPDGQRLLVGFERPGQNLLLLLDRKPQVADSPPQTNFPFHSPDSPDATAHCQLLSVATEKLPAAVRFSPDGTLLAAILKISRSNLQFWKQQSDGRFTALTSSTDSPADSVLEIIDRGDGRIATLLPGHAAPVQDVAFPAQDGSRMLAVDSRALFHWNFNTLKDYVQALRDFRQSTDDVMQELEKRVKAPGAAAVAPPQAALQSTAQPQPGQFSAQVGLPIWTMLPQPPETTDTPVEPASGQTRRVTRGTAIYSAQFSPDERWILTGADDLAAHVLDATNTEHTLSISDRPDVLRFSDTVTDVRSTERTPAASAADRTGGVNYLLEGHSSGISSLRFLPPDGNLLVTSDSLGAISVWDARDDADGVGSERSRLLPFYSSSELTVSADGQWLLVGGAARLPDDTAATPGALEYTGLLYRTSDLNSRIAPLPVLELVNGHPDAPITATAISADAQQAVTADRSGRVVLWSLIDGKQIASIDAAHDGDRISAVTFTATQQFLTAGYDGRVVSWTITPRQTLLPRAIYRGQQILKMERSPDATRVALLEVDFVEEESQDSESKGTSFLVCRILNVENRDAAAASATFIELSRLQLDDTTAEVPQNSGCAWTANGAHLLLLIRDVLSVWRTEDWKRLRRLRSGTRAATEQASPGTVGALSLAGLACTSDPDGSIRIATASGRRAQLWKLPAADAGNGRFLASLSTHHSRQLTASLSADQKFVLTASDALRVFATAAASETGKAGQTLLRLADGDAHRYPLTSAAFSPVPGDLRFASSDSSGLIRIWNWDGQNLPQSTPVTAPATDELAFPVWARQFNIASAQTKAAWNQKATMIAGITQGKAGCWTLTQQGPQPTTLPLPKDAEFLFNDITFSGTDNVLAAAGLAWDRNTRTVQFAACIWRLPDQGPPVLAAVLRDRDSEPEAAGSNQECGGLTAIRLDAAEAIAITGAQDGRVRTWRLPDLQTAIAGEFIFAVDIEDRIGSGRSSRVITHSSRITSIDLSPNRRLLTADNEGQMIVWSRDVYGN